jgi:hypothetical protein
MLSTADFSWLVSRAGESAFPMIYSQPSLYDTPCACMPYLTGSAVRVLFVARADRRLAGVGGVRALFGRGALR